MVVVVTVIHLFIFFLIVFTVHRYFFPKQTEPDSQNTVNSKE